jgi:hypothetical protein
VGIKVRHYLLAPVVAHAQVVFDTLKCYKIKDSARPKQFTTDLLPKLTHDFQPALGDRIVGGFLQKGCRLKLPAKFFCIDTATENAHDVLPPYHPAQWTIPGAESGERLCYKLICPTELPKSLAVIDAFGNRTIELRGRTEYFCTPVFRDDPANEPCGLTPNGQCGGVCPAGETCLSTAPDDCGCAPVEQECPEVDVCGGGFCRGVWETCAALPNGGCGCMHR